MGEEAQNHGSGHQTSSSSSSSSSSIPQWPSSQLPDCHHLYHIRCGVVAGGIQAIIFHPYDRALFLAQVNNRSFLNWRNFPLDIKGLDASLIQRSLTYGSFFPLETIFSNYLRTYMADNSMLIPFFSGQFAGATNGMLTNTLSLLKFQRWLEVSRRRSFMTILNELYATHGIRTLTYGLRITIMRDTIFGGTFTTLRMVPQENSMLTDFAAAFVATTLASPLNFIRTYKFAHMQEKHGAQKAKAQLQSELAELDGFGARARHLFKRLMLGYGTVRVAVGMSIGGALYRYLNDRL